MKYPPTATWINGHRCILTGDTRNKLASGSAMRMWRCDGGCERAMPFSRVEETFEIVCSVCKKLTNWKRIGI